MRFVNCNGVMKGRNWYTMAEEESGVGVLGISYLFHASCIYDTFILTVLELLARWARRYVCGVVVAVSHPKGEMTQWL